MSKRRYKIVILKGGRSLERKVSLISGKRCAKALRENGHDVVEIDIDSRLIENLILEKPDIVFNALHGGWGEDGTIQGILEWLEIPYTHSGVLASSLAMNKEKAKRMFQSVRLPVMENLIIEKRKLKVGHPLKPPYVIKPINEGSSMGVIIISDKDKFISDADFCELPKVIMVEPYVRGKELTVTVLGNKSLAVTEIISAGWYDYKAKYGKGGSKHVVPANIPNIIQEACKDYALRAHQSIGCRGISRTDFRWDDSHGIEGIFILEINTQPGMTPTSLVPEQASYCGISFLNLCQWIVEDASCCR